jgi:hypothetical protein
MESAAMFDPTIWSFTLVLVPMATGLAWKVAAARGPAAASGVVPAHWPAQATTRPHRYADHRSARSWLSAQGWDQGEAVAVSDKGTLRLAGARQARSLHA